ncbi:hypothetical protein LMJF_09_0540 [Leishmania major strain Friedlin]|uniref:Uncharacterized protein n=1 Tax=Leishmania major TaxID=5664 RepID=Q4QHX0_LEIMA|nr:hypothetical protein LMJF_09_0540 [Leishmania major strain Friedlin]CAG9569669.1 hypothetical_protein_-__conserved [Leishmania major strain Friedlin]CAJ02564.1 hypothetical protein LMJF_09_0540 [Leishmania major strain Friedlin]|eukprot:XP_001681228.1 hypothetical protein LMJF_09_0540 [Leishmania major strain Friedlin]
MTSPTHSHASTTGSRRHHTPLLQERSNSLTRRQEMLKLQNGPPSTLHYPASPQQEEADADAAMPGTVVVCGVRSAFPLIPLTDEAQIASGSAVLETPSPQSSPSSLRGVPCLRRPSSPTAATLFQRQHSGTGIGGDEPCIGNGTNAAGLPPALCTRNRATRNATGRPPRVRPYEGQEEQLAELDAEAGAEEDRFSRGLEDDGCEAGDARSASDNAASPHESDGRSSEENAERPDVAVEVIQPLVASIDDASLSSCTKRAPPPSQVVTACASAHAITETTMAHTPQARRLTYNGDSSLEELDDDQPASEEVRPRDSRYPTQESLENHSDDGEGRRASQPADQPPPRSCHAQLEQAALSPPCAPTTPTTHRQSVEAMDASASVVKTDATSSTLATQLLAETEGRRNSPGAGKEALVAHGEVMPGVLQTIGPRVMSASSDDRSRNQRAGKGSIHAHATEVEAAHSASWQTQGPQVISASAARRASRQAAESVDPWYTDADQQPSLLQTVSSCNLLGSAADLSGANSRRKVYGSMLEDHSDTPVQAEETTTVRQASSTIAAEDSADQLQSRCAGAALPPRSLVDESASKRPSLLASRASSRPDTSDGEEDYDGHLSQAKRADPKRATESMAAAACDCRRGEVDQVPPMHQPHTRKGELDDEGGKDDINAMNGRKNESEEHHQQQRPAEEEQAVGAAAARGSDGKHGLVPQHRRQVQVSALELHQIRSCRALAHESSSETHQAESIDVCEENEDSAEYISCYDVACQTSQHLLMSVREEWQGRAQSRQEASGEDDVSKIGPLDPHYVGSNRWMCAAGVCPQCHPKRRVRGSSGGFGGRSKPTWPLAPCSTLGYSAPPRPVPLQRPQGPARAATAGLGARLPPLGSSSSASTRTHPQLPPASSCQQRAQRAPSARPHSSTYASSSSSRSAGRHYRRDRYSPTVTSYQGGYCFTREWDAQQQQRQCRLRELQMEQRARRGGTGAAYTSLLLLTSHDMRSRERAAGKDPRAYRYCNLKTQQMMVHTGVGRADLALESYNDTLHGAPLIEAQEDDNDGAMKAIEAWKDREVIEQKQLRYPVAAVVSAAGSSNAATTTNPRSHAHPAASGSAKASRLCVLC